MLGSLNDFLDMPTRVQIVAENQQDMEGPISPLSKYSRRKSVQQRKRTMSGVNNYKAADKSLLFEKYSNNYPLIEKNRKEASMLQKREANENRRNISSSKLSSLFYGQNPSRMMNQAVKKDKYGGLSYQVNEPTSSELRRDHNLLRAIVRNKQNHQQKLANTNFEDSFQRMSLGLKKIKLRQITGYADVNQEHIPKSNRSLPMAVNEPVNSKMSKRDRIAFDNCLNWSKKRKKDASFYEEKLGKNKKVQKDTSVENRKSMLELIHSRSSSKDFEKTQ